MSQTAVAKQSTITDETRLANRRDVGNLAGLLALAHREGAWVRLANGSELKAIAEAVGGWLAIQWGNASKPQVERAGHPF